jgi:hypothetical protein
VFIVPVCRQARIGSCGLRLVWEICSVGRLATARLRFLFLAAKIWRHAGRVGISYSDHYEDQGLFQRLMDRVRAIAPGGDGFLPVLKTVLT